jgi:hypothetical protein
MTIHLSDCVLLSRQAVAASCTYPSDPDEVAAGLSLAPALLAAAAVKGSHPGTSHSVTNHHNARLILWRAGTRRQVHAVCLHWRQLRLM